jgi:hypothetical protein
MIASPFGVRTATYKSPLKSFLKAIIYGKSLTYISFEAEFREKNCSGE